MHPTTEFYQISGYRAHSNGWFKQYDDKPMVEAIMSNTSKFLRPGGTNSPIELVLGLLPSGASYLLMTTEQMLDFTHKHRLRVPRGPWRSTEFQSLSPIYFNSVSELSAKVATYKQRPRNKNRRESEDPLDNSQANRGYVKTGTQLVQYRSYFENQRTLYRLLTGDVRPAKVGLAQPAWLSCVRVVSLVFGQWTVDNRPRAERLKAPNLVEVGWTDALFPAFFEQLTGTTIHLKLKTLAKMNNPGSSNPAFSEVIEDDVVGLYRRLRSLLTHDTNTSGIPLIVLVHDEDMARGILERAGIDVQSWSFGLSDLLPLSQGENNSKLRRHSRSRSPQRSDAPTSYHRSSPVKIELSPVKIESSPVKMEDGEIQGEQAMTHVPGTLPAVSIVDSQRLVKALMEADPGHTVPQSAKVLHMQTDTNTCAGDDSLLQLRMWKSMAEGLAIDEQRKERSSRQLDCARVLARPQAAAAGEVDPNDFDPNDDANESVVIAVTTSVNYDFSDDDW